MSTLSMPDLLGRKDFENGSWDVAETLMAPGQAWTSIADRKMQIPEGDTELERAVRAHEMMHAKVSPAGTTQMWLDRKRASLQALKAAEEIRVNELCKRVGFDMKKVFDGTEKIGGEFTAKNDRWEQAVYDVAACAGTGRLNEYLKGVRKHNPEWAKTLRAFADRLVKVVSKIPSHDLASTNTHPKSGLTPFGYSYTESMATMIDAMANPPKPPADDPHQEQEQERRQDQGKPDAGEGTTEGEEKPAPPITPEQAKKMDMPDAGSWWHELIVERMPMPRTAPGGIGRKRKASGTGRTPRRVGRMLTDPDKKVFDVVRRGKGGVVLIDGSASMQFSQDDIKRITESAPGALVAVYCADRGDDAKPNLYVIADKGRMVAELPHRANGNGVDAPAARWALEQKQTSSSPVVWITDGLVHGPNQRYTDSQGVECARLAYENGIIVRPNVESAITMLNELKKGRKPKRWFPHCWRNSWRDVYGATLRSAMISRVVVVTKGSRVRVSNAARLPLCTGSVRSAGQRPRHRSDDEQDGRDEAQDDPHRRVVADRPRAEAGGVEHPDSEHQRPGAPRQERAQGRYRSQDPHRPDLLARCSAALISSALSTARCSRRFLRWALCLLSLGTSGAIWCMRCLDMPNCSASSPRVTPWRLSRRISSFLSTSPLGPGCSRAHVQPGIDSISFLRDWSSRPFLWRDLTYATKLPTLTLRPSRITTTDPAGAIGDPLRSAHFRSAATLPSHLESNLAVRGLRAIGVFLPSSCQERIDGAAPIRGKA